jgi:16S rRNA processing protein RimM
MSDDGSEAAEGLLLEVGRIGKAHGLNGEVSVDFVTDQLEARTAPGVELFAAERRLRVVTARPHQKRWLVRFEGIEDRNQAERLRGLTLRAVAIEDDDQVFVHELIGKSLVDQHGVDHGPIVAVIDNPASDLLELEDGRLVPLAFYQGHDDTVIEVSVPVGLLDDEPIDAT